MLDDYMLVQSMVKAGEFTEPPVGPLFAHVSVSRLLYRHQPSQIHGHAVVTADKGATEVAESLRNHLQSPNVCVSVLQQS